MWTCWRHYQRLQGLGCWYHLQSHLSLEKFWAWCAQCNKCLFSCTSWCKLCIPQFPGQFSNSATCAGENENLLLLSSLWEPVSSSALLATSSGFSSLDTHCALQLHFPFLLHSSWGWSLRLDVAIELWVLNPSSWWLPPTLALWTVSDLTGTSRDPQMYLNTSQCFTVSLEQGPGYSQWKMWRISSS